MESNKKTPLLFVGHGNPMNAIEDNKYSLGWERIGKEIESPKAIVCMSAHWLTKGSFISSNLKPETIYDFYGFPDELYHISYPAEGSPKIARYINETEPRMELDTKWGLDHGAWSVLKRMFPKADITVLQISIDYGADPKVQLELMKTIRNLRTKDILFVGSGNIVHNLGMATMNSKPYDWALEFQEKSKDLITKGDLKTLLNYEGLGTAAKMSIPTNDHYRPMLNTLALKFDNEEPVFFNEGIDLSSVSMLSFIYK